LSLSVAIPSAGFSTSPPAVSVAGSASSVLNSESAKQRTPARNHSSLRMVLQRHNRNHSRDSGERRESRSRTNIREVAPLTSDTDHKEATRTTASSVVSPPRTPWHGLNSIPSRQPHKHMINVFRPLISKARPRALKISSCLRLSGRPSLARSSTGGANPSLPSNQGCTVWDPGGHVHKVGRFTTRQVGWRRLLREFVD